MNIAVRYQSRSGNSKALAETIAQAAGVEAKGVDTPITEEVDLLFVGGGTYMGLDKELKAYLDNLDPTLVKKIAPFSTAAHTTMVEKIIEIAKEKNIPVTDDTLMIHMGSKGVHLFGGKAKSPLSDEQIAEAQEFVKKVLG